MAFLPRSQEEEILDELRVLAKLLGLKVIEATMSPTVMVRVAAGGQSSSITQARRGLLGN